MILEAEFNEHSTILETDFTENSELLNANFDDSAKFDTLIIKTLSFEKLYAISASGEIAPTQWKTEAPAPNLNAPYLWMRTIMRGTAEDGVPLVHDDGGVAIGVSVVGKDGYTPVKGKDYFDGEPGNDGVSPTVAVSKSGKVTTLSITDKNGTKTVTINDGADGSAGKDGTSVTVKSVSESTADGGSNVVTFSDGKTLTVKNGKAGTAGKTPVKGSDYWTASDQEAIIKQVISALPVYAGEVV